MFPASVISASVAPGRFFQAAVDDLLAAVASSSTADMSIFVPGAAQRNCGDLPHILPIADSLFGRQVRAWPKGRPSSLGSFGGRFPRHPAPPSQHPPLLAWRWGRFEAATLFDEGAPLFSSSCSFRLLSSPARWAAEHTVAFDVT
ncbi:hypothetical protein MRX96_027650 [Rhipicephalus microplus]